MPGRKPFILGLDANVEPDAWWQQSYPWLGQWGARISEVTNCSHTCRHGANSNKEESIIDYSILSEALWPKVISCEVDFDTPWGPCWGLRLTLDGKLEDVWTRVLVTPTRQTSSLVQKVGETHNKDDVQDDSQLDRGREALKDFAPQPALWTDALTKVGQ